MFISSQSRWRNFLEIGEASKLNKLLRAVQADLEEPFYLAGCRALGLISKFVTWPLWQKLEDKSLHIIDLPPVYKDILQLLNTAAQDPAGFLEGRLTLPWFEVDDDDPILQSLTEPTEHDGLAATILLHLLPALSKVMDSHSKPLLDLCKTSDRDQTESVDKHNKFAERVFAYLDYLMKTRPNSSLLANEATIMFSLNRTGEWLDGMAPDDMAKVMNKARTTARKLKKKFHGRVVDIVAQKRSALKEKAREKEAKAQHRLKELEKYTQDIQFHGLWQSEREVDEMISSLPSAGGKTEALKAQLRFRQHVLHQSQDDLHIFSFSEKGVSHPWQVLAQNVKRLVQHAFMLQPTIDDGAPRACTHCTVTGWKEGENWTFFFTGVILEKQFLNSWYLISWVVKINFKGNFLFFKNFTGDPRSYEDISFPKRIKSWKNS